MDPKTKISWSRILSFPLRERSERVGLSACVKHGHVAQSTNCYWLVQSVESYLMEDDLCRKTAFMDDDLWWKVPSKRWFRSIFLRSSSSLRSSQCLMSYSFLWKMTSMEDDLWRKTTFDGGRPRMARLTIVSVCPFMLLQNNAFGLSLCKTTFDGPWGRGLINKCSDIWHEITK